MAFIAVICYITIKTVKVIESDIYIRLDLDFRINLSHSDEAGLRSWKNSLKNSTLARAQEVL